MRKTLISCGLTAAAAVMTAAPVLACGGLVAPDGDVRLDKATTFVAWHGGVEHYVTSFAYSGSAADVGWIVPLPAVPSQIQAAGRWTLQRLERELNPPPPEALGLVAAASRANSPVVEQVQVEALDVTVLKGSGTEVIDWCIHNGFLLPTETRDHLLQYAHGSPVFMAAKYDTALAQQRGLQSGDGVPLQMTMRTPQLWVPLEVLANDNAPVNADLFLMTDSPLRTIAPGLFEPGTVDGATGFTLVRQEAINPSLFHDLSSDRNMAWVPAEGWVTYLTLNAPSDAVTYDLAVGSDSVIRLASFGTAPLEAAQPRAAPVTNWSILATTLALLLTVLAAYVAWRASRFAISTGSMAPSMSKPRMRLKK